MAGKREMCRFDEESRSEVRLTRTYEVNGEGKSNAWLVLMSSMRLALDPSGLHQLN